MSKTRLMTAATMGVAGLLLTGCGSASPGIAARVGDETISNRTIDTATENYCTSVGDQLESPVPMSFVRQYVVQLLTLRAQVDQIAEEYDVTPGSTYQNDVAQRQGTAATMPEDVRDDYITLTSTPAYAQDIVDQVGAKVLEERGVTDPTSDEATQAGVDVLNTWPDANGIEIDPRYGLESVDGALKPIDTNTSVAVGDIARSGLADTPDAEFAGTLPSTQRCG